MMAGSERYGSDVLLSYKTEAARERLTTEFYLWSLSVEFKFTRIFARFLPRQERATRRAEVNPGRCRIEPAHDRH